MSVSDDLSFLDDPPPDVVVMPRRFDSDSNSTDKSTIPDDPDEKAKYMKRNEYIVGFQALSTRKQVIGLAGAVYDLNDRVSGIETRMGSVEQLLNMVLQEVRALRGET